MVSFRPAPTLLLNLELSEVHFQRLQIADGPFDELGNRHIGIVMQLAEPLPPKILETRSPCEVRLHLLAATLIDNLAPHGIADIHRAIACWGQSTAYAVDALARASALE
jgi:hypothetical protein